MTEDNILLVTDDNEVASVVLSKLILLRESDSIAVADYSSVDKFLKDNSVSVVIVHENIDRTKTLELIKRINKSESEVILLVNDYEQDFILAAYDFGVTDYYSVESESYNMLIRTVNSFRMRSLKNKVLKDQLLLNLLGIVDSATGFYKFNDCKELFCEFLKNKQVKRGMFVILALDESSKTKSTSNKLAKAISNSIRCEDMVFSLRGGKFYLLLPNIDKTGAFAVVDKTQNNLGEKLVIRAGVCTVEDKSFDKLEREAYAALTEACQNNERAVFLQDKVKTLDAWLSPDEKDVKNFKLFKNAYNNKLENVIAPVFFRLQKAYETKLFNTKIEQYTDEMQSVFYLKNDKQESSLKIIYPGFAKIVIYIVHEGLDSPENREISLNLNEITLKGLAKIVEDFIKEFKANVDV